MESSFRMACPECGEKQTWRTVRFGMPFKCSRCERSLRIPESYSKAGAYPSMAGAAIITYLAAPQGMWLVAVPVLVFFLLSSIIGTAARLLFPPILELADSDFRLLG